MRKEVTTKRHAGMPSPVPQAAALPARGALRERLRERWELAERARSRPSGEALHQQR